MAQLQHWSVTCTTCDNPAEYHCNTCGDILCPRCRDIHQRSRGTGHHSVVPYSQRVEPGKLTEQCDDHPGQQCLLWCERCDKGACTDCVTSSDHKGHEFVKMAAKLGDQRKIIQEEFNNYSKLLKQWEGSLQQFQSSIKVYESDLGGVGEEITKAADRVCKQVRNIEAALQKQLQDMKNTQRSIFSDHEKVLLNGIEKIKQQVMEAEDKLRSDDTEVLLQHKAREDTGIMNAPPYPDISANPIFTPGKVEVHALKTMLGKLTKTTEKSYSTMIDERSAVKKVFPTDTTSTHRNSSQSTSGATGFTSSKMTLLPAATVMTTIQADKEYSPHLVCAESDLTWVRIGSNRLQMMDRQGSVKRTVDTGSTDIGVMSITPQGDLLISDSEDKSIKSVSENGNIKTLFKTSWTPFGICSLLNGDIVVAFFNNSRVVQYSGAGKVVRELDKSHFSCPYNVAQNKINRQIFVVDNADVCFDSLGRLLTFNMMSGKLEYEYTGPDATTFTPCDVCTDQADHVIITDWKNDRIHILDQDGRFLQYMMTRDQGLYRPCSIDTDNDGYVWISEYDYGKLSRVKVVKYIE